MNTRRGCGFRIVGYHAETWSLTERSETVVHFCDVNRAADQMLLRGSRSVRIVALERNAVGIERYRVARRLTKPAQVRAEAALLGRGSHR